MYKASFLRGVHVRFLGLRVEVFLRLRLQRCGGCMQDSVEGSGLRV